MSKARKLSPEEDQLLAGISAMLTLPILLGGILYVAIYLHSVTGLVDINQGITYTFLIVAPVSMGFYLAVYEVLYSRKIKKPLRFHIRRFMSRIVVVIGYFLGFGAVWSAFFFFLSALISLRYILLLTLLTSSSALGLLVALPKTRQMIEKFTKGEK